MKQPNLLVRTGLCIGLAVSVGIGASACSGEEEEQGIELSYIEVDMNGAQITTTSTVPPAPSTTASSSAIGSRVVMQPGQIKGVDDDVTYEYTIGPNTVNQDGDFMATFKVDARPELAQYLDSDTFIVTPYCETVSGPESKTNRTAIGVSYFFPAATKYEDSYSLYQNYNVFSGDNMWKLFDDQEKEKWLKSCDDMQITIDEFVGSTATVRIMENILGLRGR